MSCAMLSKMPPTKKYICSFCARPFSRSEHKLRHERSHTNTKPFTCTACNTSFVRRDLMQRHLRNVHKVDSVTASRATGITNAATTTKGAVGQEMSTPVTDVASLLRSPESTASNMSSPSPVTSRRSSIVHIESTTRDTNDVTQLLTLSKSHQSLQSILESNVATLLFLYGTSNVPIPVDSSTAIAAMCYSAAFVQMNDCFKLFHRALAQPHVKSLAILAWTYLQHHESLSRNLIPIDVIFAQLDALLVQHQDAEIDGLDYWFIYGVQAEYVLRFNKQPPLSHTRMFLHREVGGKPLSEWLRCLSKSSGSLPHQQLDCLLHCLIMELQNLKFNSQHILHKFEAHNAIIMFNKHYISRLIQQHAGAATQQDQFSRMVMLTKRHLLLNVPQAIQDLVVDYVLVPLDHTHSALLHLTLRELQYWNCIQPYRSTTGENSSSLSLMQWFQGLNITTVNNNLGLVAYPLIVLGSLPLELSGLKKEGEFREFVTEVFLMLVKVIMERSKVSDFSENVVIKGMLYLLFESGNETVPKDVTDENESTIVGKLFTLLTKWITYFEDDALMSGVEQFQGQVLTIEGSGMSSPGVNSPLFSRHSSISDQAGSDGGFSIVKSPPSYNYFHTQESIRLPPLNLPKKESGLAPLAPLTTTYKFS